MAFEIGWLESARRELDAEIEYVYSFDEKSLVTILAVWNNYQDPNKINELLSSKQ
jgi:hypothetical protein